MDVSLDRRTQCHKYDIDPLAIDGLVFDQHFEGEHSQKSLFGTDDGGVG